MNFSTEMKKLCRRIGYSFSDPAIFREALTHRSYGVPHNERLEFLGDSILNCAVAQALFNKFPDLSEGDLSRLRSNLVNQSTLCEIAIDMNIGEAIFLGEGEMKSGGFRRPSILADSVEALFGAIFIDAGFDMAVKIIQSLYFPRIEAINPKTLNKDPKTLLQEFLQGKKFSLPLYGVIGTTGKAHNQHFTVECAIEELNIRAQGEGSSRRAAEQAAAQAALSMVCR